mgnify:CR=1 FL=1
MPHTKDNCGCASILYSEAYTDLDGQSWVYIVTNKQHVQRSLLYTENWKDLTEEDYATMTAGHLEFVESLTL